MATVYRVQIVKGGGLLKLASVEVQFDVARKLAEWYFAMGVPTIVEEVKTVLALDPGVKPVPVLGTPRDLDNLSDPEDEALERVAGTSFMKDNPFQNPKT